MQHANEFTNFVMVERNDDNVRCRVDAGYDNRRYGQTPCPDAVRNAADGQDGQDKRKHRLLYAEQAYEGNHANGQRTNRKACAPAFSVGGSGGV